MSRADLVQLLVDKDEIRQLVLLYARGVDRQDTELLRGLYTAEAIDDHGPVFCGAASDYIDLLESTFAFITVGGHYVCNHLIDITGPDLAEGEVYTLGYHVIPTPGGGFTESFVGVRYLDQYRRAEGRWLFARRVVVFDLDSTRPLVHGGARPEDPTVDRSYDAMSSPLFRRYDR